MYKINASEYKERDTWLITAFDPADIIEKYFNKFKTAFDIWYLKKQAIFMRLAKHWKGFYNVISLFNALQHEETISAIYQLFLLALLKAL